MSDAAKSADFFDDLDHPKMELLRAAEQGSLEAVEALLGSGVDVDSANDDCESVLQTAAAGGHLKLVELLLESGACIESENIVGFTPFLHACRNGHAAVVDLLLQRGANPTRTTSMGATALSLAIASNSGEVIKKLITLTQQDIDCARHLAPTPLMTAIYRHSPKLCGLLVRRGANPNFCHQGLRELTPLAFSVVLRCSSALFSTLLELGANPARPCMGQSVYHMVERWQRLSLKDILENNSRGLRTLKENPVDIRKLVLDGRNDLLEKTLRDRATEPALAKERLVGALFFAAVVGNLDAVRLLVVNSNCDINAQDGCGMTALMYALVCGHNDVAKCLLSLQADVFRRTTEKFGAFNALEIAYFSRCFDLEVLQLIHQRFVAHHSKQSQLTSSTTSLDRAFGNFGLGARKHWINKVSGKLGLAESPSDATEAALARKQEFLAELGQSHVDWSRPDRFVLPAELLQGDKKVDRIREIRPDDYTAAARRLTLYCYSHGFLLKEFPIGTPSTSLDSPLRQSARLASSYGSYRLHSSEGSRSLDSSGSFASVAQQLAFEFDQHAKDRRARRGIAPRKASNGHSSSLGARRVRLGTNPRSLPSPMVSRAGKLQCPNSPSSQSLRHFSAENSASSFAYPTRSASKSSLAPASGLVPSAVHRSISASHIRTRSTPDSGTPTIELIWRRLEHANLGQYRAVFVREELDEETIISLTEDDLLNIHVTNAEHRQKLLKIIRAFQYSQYSTPR